jgi:hypothetical protein
MYVDCRCRALAETWRWEWNKVILAYPPCLGWLINVDSTDLKRMQPTVLCVCVLRCNIVAGYVEKCLTCCYCLQVPPCPVRRLLEYIQARFMSGWFVPSSASRCCCIVYVLSFQVL